MTSVNGVRRRPVPPAAIAAELAAWRNLRDTAEPHLTGIESLGFSHTLLRLEAELAWHEECLKTLPVT